MIASHARLQVLSGPNPDFLCRRWFARCGFFHAGWSPGFKNRAPPGASQDPIRAGCLSKAEDSAARGRHCRIMTGYSVAAGSGLAGYKNQLAGGALSALMGEGVKNADDGAISGQDPERDHGHGSKSHHENNQYATQVQAHFPNRWPPEFAGGIGFWTR